MCKASEQGITSHASEDKGKVRHTKRTGKKRVEEPRMMVLFVLWRSLYCLYVHVYWTTATRWLSNRSHIISYHITS